MCKPRNDDWRGRVEFPKTFRGPDRADMMTFSFALQLQKPTKSYTDRCAALLKPKESDRPITTEILKLLRAADYADRKCSTIVIDELSLRDLENEHKSSLIYDPALHVTSVRKIFGKYIIVVDGPVKVLMLGDYKR